MRGALAELIRAHDPYPAVVVDRGWDLVMANRARRRSSTASPSTSSGRPGTSYRITLHPDGMAPRIVNFGEWAHHLLGHAAPPGRRDP